MLSALGEGCTEEKYLAAAEDEQLAWALGADNSSVVYVYLQSVEPPPEEDKPACASGVCLCTSRSAHLASFDASTAPRRSWRGASVGLAGATGDASVVGRSHGLNTGILNINTGMV